MFPAVLMLPMIVNTTQCGTAVTLPTKLRGLDQDCTC